MGTEALRLLLPRAAKQRRPGLARNRCVRRSGRVHPLHQSPTHILPHSAGRQAARLRAGRAGARGAPPLKPSAGHNGDPFIQRRSATTSVARCSVFCCGHSADPRWSPCHRRGPLSAPASTIGAAHRRGRRSARSRAKRNSERRRRQHESRRRPHRRYRVRVRSPRPARAAWACLLCADRGYFLTAVAAGGVASRGPRGQWRSTASRD